MKSNIRSYINSYLKSIDDEEIKKILEHYMGNLFNIINRAPYKRENFLGKIPNGELKKYEEIGIFDSNYDINNEIKKYMEIFMLIKKKLKENNTLKNELKKFIEKEKGSIEFINWVSNHIKK